MAVDGGTGSQIKFSELQAYYGGQGEIRLSDYFRGGDFVPSTQGGNQTITINSTGGANSWTKGGGTIANSRAISVTIPANTTLHSNTHTFSSAFTNTVYSNWGKHHGQDDWPPYYGTVSSNIAVNYGNYSSSFTGNTRNVGSANTSVGVREIAGPWHLAWYVSSGSGISVTSTANALNTNFSGWSHGTHVPGNPGSNPLILAGPNARPTQWSGDYVSVADNSRSRTFSFSGSTGSSPCTVRLVMFDRINDPTYAAWMPNLNGFTGTQNTTNPANTSIPGSGQITLNHFNSPGSPAP